MPKNTEPKHKSNPRYQASEEEKAWLDMVPIGREFGSPDYERLTALDQAAFAVFQSWEQVWDWLATPNPQLEGMRPEDAVRNPDGFSKVMCILMRHLNQASDDFMGKAEKLSVQERAALNGLTDIKSLKGMFGRPSKRASIEDMNSAIARRGAKKK